MSVLILPRTLTAQPQQAVDIASGYAQWEWVFSGPFGALNFGAGGSAGAFSGTAGGRSYGASGVAYLVGQGSDGSAGLQLPAPASAPTNHSGVIVFTRESAGEQGLFDTSTAFAIGGFYIKINASNVVEVDSRSLALILTSPNTVQPGINVVAWSHTPTTLTIALNGVVASVADATAYTWTAPISFGSPTSSGGVEAVTHRQYLSCFSTSRALSAGNLAALSRNPWQIFKAPPRRLWVQGAAAGDAAQAEATAAAEASTAALATAAAQVEAAAASDASSATRATAAAQAEAAAAADASSATLAIAAAQAEPTTATDAASAFAAFLAALVESAAAADTSNWVGGTVTAAQTEAATAVDATSAALATAAAQADAAAAADASSATRATAAAQAEAAAANDAASAFAAFLVALVEPAAAADTSNWVAAGLVSASQVEAAAATDSSSAFASFLAAIVEPASAADLVAVAGGVLAPSGSGYQSVHINVQRIAVSTGARPTQNNTRR